MNARITTCELCVLAASLLPVLTAGALAAERPGGLHSASDIARARRRIQLGGEPWRSAYARLRAEADKDLQLSPHAVEVFIIPPFADDYEGFMRVCKTIWADTYAAYACALAYQLTREEPRRVRYAEKVIEILNAWASTNTTFKARAESYHRKDGWKKPFVPNQLISSSGGCGLIHAADLVWEYDGWKPTDRYRFAKWVNTVHRPEADKIKAFRNGSNWVCWGTLASVSGAHLVGDRKGLEADIEHIKKWIEKHIAEDGHLPAEMRRGTSGMWYTYYALTSMTAACYVVWNATGTDLFHYRSPNGRSLKLALDYFFEHCRTPEKWPTGTQRAVGAAGQLKRGSFPDIWWGANLLEAMGAVYDERSYGEFVRPVRPITLTARHTSHGRFPR